MYCPFSMVLREKEFPLTRECDSNCALFVQGSGCAFVKIAKELEKQSNLKSKMSKQQQSL